MSRGMTRSEQWMLTGLVALFVGYFAWNERERAGIWPASPDDARWQPVLRMTADGGEARPVGRASSADPRDDAGLLININTATAAELERLPGIGPSRAASILQHREERGGFRSVEDLLGVHQIGPGILSSLKPQVTVGEAIGSPATAPDRAVGESADAATPLAAPSDPSPPAPVNINAASLEELQRIHGIGPVLAARIIERRSRAPFQSPRELLEIQGIGETTLEKMLPMVVVR